MRKLNNQRMLWETQIEETHRKKLRGINGREIYKIPRKKDVYIQ
jgi:hypothetical protein